MRDTSFSEDKTVLENWEETGLLQGLNGIVKNNIANCMQAQMKFNESVKNDALVQWKRVSIPVVRRIAEAEVFKRNRFVLESVENKPEVHICNTQWSFSEPQRNDDGHHSLQIEADTTAVFAEQIKKEIDGLFSDQYNKNIYFRGLSCNESGQVCILYNLN